MLRWSEHTLKGDASKLDSAALHACVLSQEHAEKVEPVDLVLELQEGDYIIARYRNLNLVGEAIVTRCKCHLLIA